MWSDSRRGAEIKGGRGRERTKERVRTREGGRGNQQVKEFSKSDILQIRREGRVAVKLGGGGGSGAVLNMQSVGRTKDKKEAKRSERVREGGSERGRE